MKANRYTRGNGEHTPFVKKNGGHVVILLIYVDDMIVTGDDNDEMFGLKKLLVAEFELKDFGKLRYFLSIKLARSKIRLISNQIKYTFDLLNETKKLKCHPVSTLIEANHKSLKDGDKLTEKEKGKYQRLVDKLFYLTLTKFYITYIVNIVSQFMHVPTTFTLMWLK